MIYRDAALQSWYRTNTGLRIEYRISDTRPTPLLAIDFTTPATSFDIAWDDHLEPDPGVLLNHLCLYPLDQVLTVTALAGMGGALHHSAGGIIDGSCWIFPGVSGAGKSTLSGLLRHRPEIELLSDDRMISRRLGDKAVGFGTPWPGDEKIAVNKSAPLGGFMFLEQAGENRVERLPPVAVFERLLPVTSIQWFEPALFDPVLKHLEFLSQSVPGYRLLFRKDPSVADVVLDAVR